MLKTIDEVYAKSPLLKDNDEVYANFAKAFDKYHDEGQKCVNSQILLAFLNFFIGF